MPIKTAFSNEPTGEQGQYQMMFPSLQLNDLKIVSSQFGLGILDAAFDKIAFGLAKG